MKRKLLLILLVLSLMLALFACGGDKCTSHTDADKDARCDRCGAAVACTECTDADGDGKCDVCAGDVEKTPCTAHVDANKDAACDRCGAAVACTECTDTDGDGKCDVCGGDTVTELPLLINGEPNFQFVLASGIHIDIRRTVEQSIVRSIKSKTGIEIVSVTEGANSDTEREIEVLIGDVTTRGDKYVYDRYSLGKEGYVIKAVGTKILINAGSDEMLIEAIGEFAEDILGFDGRDIDTDAKMLSTDSIEEIQDNYKITSLSVNGADMRGYVIATDTKNESYNAAALTLQDTIYDRTGYWFKIVPPDEADGKAVVLKSIPRVYGEDSFKVSANGDQLLIECAFENKLSDTIAAFVTQTITQGKGDVNFESTVFKRDISFVTYEDFGAKGDGKTDDFRAIYNAHVYANECGQRVIGKSGRTYYIYNTLDDNDNPDALTIPIKTDTVWTGVSFIIDDSTLDCAETFQRRMSAANIFTVVSDYEDIIIDSNDISCPNCEKWVAISGDTSVAFTRCSSCDTIIDMEDYEENLLLKSLGGIGCTYGTTKIDLKLGYPALLVITNKDHGIYRRYGADYANRSYDGTGQYAEQHEIILVDAEGNISSETPFMFDYTTVTSIRVIRTDVTPVTITGGTVTTKACGLDASYYDSIAEKDVKFGYINRGLSVQRSNTTVDGLKHIVTGEITVEQEAQQDMQGAHYHGFFTATDASYVTFKSCVMQGRRYYSLSGTYDFSATRVNKIVLDHCVQSNFWIDEDGNASDTNTGKVSMEKVEFTVDGVTKSHCYTWGIGGTNFCKNMEYVDSRLSRFDAHQGLYNGKVIRCELQAFEIIGKGDFLVEDVTWYTYGAANSSSNSVLALRSDYGSTWEGEIVIDGFNLYTTSDTVYLVSNSYKNWYFGYTCHLPSLDISGLKIYDKATGREKDEGFVVNLYSRGMASEPYMHLDTTKGTTPMTIQWSCPEGTCQSGCVNEIIDYKCDACGVTGEYIFAQDTTRPRANDNLTMPPEYVRVRENEAGYIFRTVADTANDPKHFFANTKFYVGASDTELFTGTYQTEDTDCFLLD